MQKWLYRLIFYLHCLLTEFPKVTCLHNPTLRALRFSIYNKMNGRDRIWRQLEALFKDQHKVTSDIINQFNQLSIYFWLGGDKDVGVLKGLSTLHFWREMKGETQLLVHGYL